MVPSMGSPRHTCPLEASGEQNQGLRALSYQKYPTQDQARGHKRDRWGGRGTHKDMCKISLVSGFQTPRSSCSKLDMRATPAPTNRVLLNEPVARSCPYFLAELSKKQTLHSWSPLQRDNQPGCMTISCRWGNRLRVDSLAKGHTAYLEQN